jgi:hypothetical protein
MLAIRRAGAGSARVELTTMAAGSPGNGGGPVGRAMPAMRWGAETRIMTQECRGLRLDLRVGVLTDVEENET